MIGELASMAWRNLWRHRRRTLLTLASIAFGVSLAVIFTALGDRTYADMIDLAARMGGGHVTVQHPEFHEAPTLSRSVPGADALAEAAAAEDGVARVVQRVAGNLMLASARKNTGAAFIAYDPAVEDAETLSLLEALVEGGVHADDGAPGIVLGAKLAENLGAGVGRKLVYTATDRSGEIVQEAVRVSGILRTGTPSVDGSLVLLPLESLRRTLGYAPDEAGQVAVFLDDQRSAGTVAARLQARLGDAVAVLPWYERQPELASFIAMKVGGTQFMEGIILLLVAAGIFNTLFVSVMERLREFGVLLAIGFTPGRLFAMVMFESLWLGLVGLVAAGVLVAAPYAYLANVGIDVAAIAGQGLEVAGVGMNQAMRVGIYPENAVMIALAALAATLLSGVYPALSAGRVDPVETIRLV